MYQHSRALEKTQRKKIIIEERSSIATVTEMRGLTSNLCLASFLFLLCFPRFSFFALLVLLPATILPFVMRPGFTLSGPTGQSCSPFGFYTVSKPICFFFFFFRSRSRSPEPYCSISLAIFLHGIACRPSRQTSAFSVFKLD